MVIHFDVRLPACCRPRVAEALAEAQALAEEQNRGGLNRTFDPDASGLIYWNLIPMPRDCHLSFLVHPG